MIFVLAEQHHILTSNALTNLLSVNQWISQLTDLLCVKSDDFSGFLSDFNKVVLYPLLSVCTFIETHFKLMLLTSITSARPEETQQCIVVS